MSEMSDILVNWREKLAELSAYTESGRKENLFFEEGLHEYGRRASPFSRVHCIEGNMSIILCERGIRTFETATRNTLDISAVPLIKLQSPLPVIVDPSHASGERT